MNNYRVTSCEHNCQRLCEFSPHGCVDCGELNSQRFDNPCDLLADTTNDPKHATMPFATANPLIVHALRQPRFLY